MTEMQKQIEEMERDREEKNKRQDQRDRDLIRETKEMMEGGLRDRSELDFGTFSEDRLNVEEPARPSGLINDVDKLLEKLDLVSSRVPLSMSKKAKKRRRYYIRRREREGKPYIPASVRALGKETAKSLGHEKWEVRLPPSLEEQTVYPPDRTVERLQGFIISQGIKDKLHFFWDSFFKEKGY